MLLLIAVIINITMRQYFYKHKYIIMKTTIIYKYLALITLLVSGCVVGRKLSFDNSIASIGYTPAGKIAVAFQDKREVILNGKEKESFCGHMYGGYAIAYNVQTESGKAVAEDFSQSVKKTLEHKAVPVTVLTITPTGDNKALIDIFQKGGYDKLLLYTINTWESRCTALFSKMRYETNSWFTLTVIDKTGNTLALHDAKDILIKEQGAGASVKVLQAVADECFKKQMQELWNNEKIKMALQ